MSSSIENSVQRIRNAYFAFAATAPGDLAAARVRGVPDALLEFYSLCDGAFIGNGSDFRDPNGRRYRLMVPRLSELQTAQSFGYISVDSPLYEKSAQWWQIVDYGDSNWLAYDGTLDGGGRVIDIFHETVGDPDYHEIVASSLNDLLDRLLKQGDVYWFDDDFESLGWV